MMAGFLQISLSFVFPRINEKEKKYDFIGISERFIKFWIKGKFSFLANSRQKDDGKVHEIFLEGMMSVLLGWFIEL
jgi:hypothetical protein